jgi:hypothetical protein
MSDLSTPFREACMLALLRIPNADERKVVFEWCDRYRMLFDAYEDAGILKLGVKMWCEGRINQDGGRAMRPHHSRTCP